MKFLAVLGVFFGVPALLALSVLLNGWALHILWGWFIAPVFGVPVLSIAQSIGVAMVIGFSTYQYIESTSDKNGRDRFAGAVGATVLRPLVSVALGWVVHLFL